MRLREFMRSNVITIESAEDASVAWSRMQRRRIRHLVVTENGQLVGVLSERDLGGRSGASVRKGKLVRELMSPKVVTAGPETTLRQAANLMRGRLVGSLPVVEEDRLVGIVTATDVLDELGRGFTRPAVGGRRRLLRSAPPNRRKSDSNPIVHRRSRARGQTGTIRPRTPDSTKRSPPPGWIPRAAKRKAGRTEINQVPAHIRAEGAELRPADRAYIRRKLGMKLGKFATSIERLTVRVEDLNGPRGGVDHACRIKVVLSGLPSVVYETRDASLHAAIGGALTGVERTVRRMLQRRRMKPLRRAA
jgi:CBS domain-containing protein